MLHLDFVADLPKRKLTPDMTDKEEARYIEQEYRARSDMMHTSDYLDHSCRSLLNQMETIECKKQYPGDPLWINYSCEEWTLNENVKKVLARFRDFFQKAFNYIGSFVSIRVDSAIKQCEQWHAILADSNRNQEKIDNIFNNNTTRAAKTEFLVNAINSAADAYQKLSDQANNIKGMKGIGNSDADKTKLQTMFAFPPEYQKFLDNKKMVEDSTPTSGTGNENAGFTYKDGGWDDAAKIDNIIKALNHIKSNLANIKRLQTNCDEMVRGLEKEEKGEAADKALVKELNNEKIKFLRDLSKKVLSGMMGDIGKFVSIAAKNCKTFCTNYSGGTQ